MRLLPSIIACLVAASPISNQAIVRQSRADFTTEIKQITFGPSHHFFGYIGHVQTIPWNRSGRFVLALQT